MLHFFFFLTRNNCWKFLASYDNIFQIDNHLYLKAAVCGAPLSYSIDYVNYFADTSMRKATCSPKVMTQEKIFTFNKNELPPLPKKKNSRSTCYFIYFVLRIFCVSFLIMASSFKINFMGIFEILIKNIFT